MFEISLTPEQQTALVGSRPVARYAASQILFYRSHTPAGLWLLLDGELALRDNGRIHAYVVGPSLLGLEEVVNNQPYPYTAQAMTPCELVFIGKEEIGPDLVRAPLVDIISHLSYYTP